MFSVQCSVFSVLFCFALSPTYLSRSPQLGVVTKFASFFSGKLSFKHRFTVHQVEALRFQGLGSRMQDQVFGCVFLFYGSMFGVQGPGL